MWNRKELWGPEEVLEQFDRLIFEMFLFETLSQN